MINKILIFIAKLMTSKMKRHNQLSLFMCFGHTKSDNWWYHGYQYFYCNTCDNIYSWRKKVLQ